MSDDDMMRDSGRVTQVKVTYLGSPIISYDSGVPSIVVEDSGDFDELGGTLELEDATYDYTAVDEDTETITLDTVLGSAPTAGSYVYLYPRGEVRYAYVRIDPDDDDELACRVPKSLASQLDEGVRGDENTQELVEVEYDDATDEWWIVNIPETIPTLNITHVPWLGVRKSNSADQTIASGDVKTYVNFDTVDYSSFADTLDTSDDSFITIPDGYEGYYEILCQLQVENGTAGERWKQCIEVGSGFTAVEYGVENQQATGAAHRLTLRSLATVYLNPLDTVSAYLKWTGGSTKTCYLGQSELSVRYLGREGTTGGGVGSSAGGGGTTLTDHDHTASGDGGVLTAALMDSYIEGTESSDPAAPAANSGRLYFRDNGSGKTQLCVRFASGAIQVIATQP